jgi:lactoylglutathione lyase
LCYTEITTKKSAEKGGVFMNFTFAHNNFNVMDLDKSIRFYKEALGLEETRRIHADDGSVCDRLSRRRTEPASAGAYLAEGPQRTPMIWGTMSFIWHWKQIIWMRLMKSMQKWAASVMKTPGMGIYFIQDPDQYWIRNYTGEKMNPIFQREARLIGEDGVACLSQAYRQLSSDWAVWDLLQQRH